MCEINYQNAAFLISAATAKQFPPDNGIEIAFIGRSNSGKSSAINALTGKKRLAKISKTPGRTQLLNFFTLEDNKRLVDLPGYGFAKVPLKLKQKWCKTIDKYLRGRKSLCCLVLIMDIRHPCNSFDLQILNWASEANLHVHILLTKSDKLSHNLATNTLKTVKNNIVQSNKKVSIQTFSSTKKSGITELSKQLSYIFNPDIS